MREEVPPGNNNGAAPLYRQTALIAAKQTQARHLSRSARAAGRA